LLRVCCVGFDISLCYLFKKKFPISNLLMKMSEMQDPPCDAMGKLSLQPHQTNSNSSSPPCSASSPVHSDASVVMSPVSDMLVSPARSDCSMSAVSVDVDCIQEGNSSRQRSISEGTQAIKGILKHRAERCYSECDANDSLDVDCSSCTSLTNISSSDSGSVPKKTVRFCEEVVRGVYFTNVGSTGKSRTKRLNRRRRLRRLNRGLAGAGQSSTPNIPPSSLLSGSTVEVDVDLGAGHHQHQVEPSGWRASTAPDPEQCPTIEENARLDSAPYEIGRRIANSRFRVVPVHLPCTSANNEQAGSNQIAANKNSPRMNSLDSGVETMSSSTLGPGNCDTMWP
ncbi:hypothetical protein T06_14841, partial [Trichinella sp. T6]